jgi:hypothetical protein
MKIVRLFQQQNTMDEPSNEIAPTTPPHTTPYEPPKLTRQCRKRAIGNDENDENERHVARRLCYE